MLHHDHLLDFALAEVRRLAMDATSVRVSALWGRNVELFRDLLRFAPVWVCRKCNEGDGWAKAENWLDRSSAVYPASFSMTLAELALMRDQARSRRLTAEAIWRSVGTDHANRREAVTKVAEAIIAEEFPVDADEPVHSPRCVSVGVDWPSA